MGPSEGRRADLNWSFRYYCRTQELIRLVSLAEPFNGRFKKHRVSFSQNARNAIGEWARLERFSQIELFDLRCVRARKPMISLAEEVVPHLGPIDQVERFGVGPQAK